MEEKSIVSPCISVCKTDPLSGYCYGCGRTNDEKLIWKNEKTTNEWKLNNIMKLKKRLSSWQLEAFERSYQSKLDTGLSLLKKKISEQKN
tara:strand:+ start:747 stop:1016 length:270 start_codon:yes stop_codon:yes gene_type:complete